MPGDITHLLDAVEHGDREAGEALLPLVYEELRRLAAFRMAQEKPGQTLQPTALVHEAWLKIAGALDLAPRTVDRLWAFARAWLKRAIRPSLSGPADGV